MSVTTDFRQVTGIAKIHWTLKTETPLCIRSGTTSAYSQQNKTVDFAVKTIGESDEGNVSDFYFDIRFNNQAADAPEVVFRIPASSIRGALRNYTIKRLVPKAFRRATLFAKKDDPDTDEQSVARQEARLKQAIGLPGWHLIQNLFGLAADSSDEEVIHETVAGRLRIISDEVICSTKDLNQPDSPLVAVMRSPLDRATRATKIPGLHSFMEFLQDNEFQVGLNVINPSPEDLGFVAFWENSINQGLLRMGGLAGIGKGRLQVKKSEVTLFSRETSRFYLADGNGKRTEACGDILADLFPKRSLSWNELKNGYLDKLKEKYKQLEKGE